MRKKLLSLLLIAIQCLSIITIGAQVTQVTIGSGEDMFRIPYDFYWRSNLYECIYYARELGQPGFITGIILYPTQSSIVHGYPAKLWIGTTNLDNLSDGWVNSNQLTLVYDGDYIANPEVSEYEIKFSEPFFYTGQNLVLLSYHAHYCYCYSNYYFKAQSNVPNRARNYYSDAYVPDPANPTIAGTLTAQHPKITFLIER